MMALCQIKGDKFCPGAGVFDRAQVISAGGPGLCRELKLLDKSPLLLMPSTFGLRICGMS